MAAGGLSAMVLASTPAQATPITYTFTGIASGKSNVDANGNGTPFTNKQVSITLLSDTNGVFYAGGINMIYEVGASKTTFDIAGVGTGTVFEQFGIEDWQSDSTINLAFVPRYSKRSRNSSHTDRQAFSELMISNPVLDPLRLQLELLLIVLNFTRIQLWV